MGAYECAPGMAATGTGFCGAGMVHKDGGTVEPHVDGTIDALGESLAPCGYKGPSEEPMRPDGLKRIQAPPSADSPPQSPELQDAARRITGRGG